MKNPNPIGMIQTIRRVAFAMLFVTCFFASCSKKKEGCTNPAAINFNKAAEEDDGSCILAGRPGMNTVVAFPQYNSIPVINTSHYKDTAYVKYNTLVFPGDNPTLYDFIVAGEFAENHVHITKLKPGNYYIFMAGRDPLSGDRVTGGLGYTLTDATTEVDVVIPVTP